MMSNPNSNSNDNKAIRNKAAADKYRKRKREEMEKMKKEHEQLTLLNSDLQKKLEVVQTQNQILMSLFREQCSSWSYNTIEEAMNYLDCHYNKYNHQEEPDNLDKYLKHVFDDIEKLNCSAYDSSII